MTLRTVIRSCAHYVPEKRVTNADLSQFMETSDAWIAERTGIRERRFIESPGIGASELAVKAAERALERAGWRASDIDFIVASTLSPDFYFPGIGVLVQKKLGCGTVPALDIRAQCSGLVYGIATVDAFIRSGQAKKVLLVCAEVQSPCLDLTTRGREMAVLFGDGAGALCIEALPEDGAAGRGVLDSVLGSDGAGAEVLCLKVPGTATPGFIRHSDLEEHRVHPFMDGKVVFKNAVSALVRTAKEILARNQVAAGDLSLVLPHQANLRINEMVRESLELPVEKVFNNIQQYGNTTAATIPICMSEAVEQGRLHQGDLVLTLAFGAGFTWGANLIRW